MNHQPEICLLDLLQKEQWLVTESNLAADKLKRYDELLLAARQTIDPNSMAGDDYHHQETIIKHHSVALKEVRAQIKNYFT